MPLALEDSERNHDLTNHTAPTPATELKKLIESIRQFTGERDWEQFHTPKNLSMALSVEAAEILELFQWLTPEESTQLKPEKRDALRDEIGDVFIYLLNLADKCGIDPLEAASNKLASNARKYPAEVVKGKALKYSEYPTSRREKTADGGTNR